MRGRTQSHGTPISRGNRKLSTVFPKRSRETPGIIRAGVTETIAMTDPAAKTGLAVMTGLVVKTDTTAKTVTTKAEEKKTPFCYFHGKDQGH